jgi:hypothetical protein
VYIPILEDGTDQVSLTFDQLLDSLMEGKKGLAEGALHKDDFLTPQMKEHEVGLQVFRSLEKRNEEDKRQTASPGYD